MSAKLESVTRHVVDGGGFKMVEKYQPTAASGRPVSAVLIRRDPLSGNIVERVPHIFPSNGHNERYLETKATRSGHLL